MKISRDNYSFIEIGDRFYEEENHNYIYINNNFNKYNKCNLIYTSPKQN